MPKASRNKPEAHRSGVALYRPTTSFPRWRVVWTDPITGKRPNRSAWTEAEAKRIFDDAVAYVETSPKRPTVAKLTGEPTMRDLFAEQDRRWVLTNRSQQYRDNRRSIFEVWIDPVCGSMPVREWLLDDEPCLTVMAAARKLDKRPATMQNIGSLMRSLVTTAHRLRWGPSTANPMAEVPYTASALVGAGVRWVPPSERPTTTMVDELAVCMAIAAKDARRAVEGMDEMASVAGYAGLRSGEQTALGPAEVDHARRGIHVVRAWRQPKGVPPQLHPPKGGKTRFVLLPGSLFDVVAERAAKAVPGPNGVTLLWPGPNGPGMPWTEVQLRRLFYRAAAMCDWPLEDDSTPAIPYRNLRHHAATWMHDIAGFDWADVSVALGHHSVSFTHARYVRPGAGAEARNRARMEDL